MKRTPYFKIQTCLFTVMGTLMAALLLYLWCTPNTNIQQSRNPDGYQIIQHVSCQTVENPAAPAGIIRQFRFRLEDNIAYDTTLAFFLNHQNAEVSLDGETVYSLQPADTLSLIRTPGANWVMIPLYREDAGKEVLVELTPVYQNYLNQDIQFLIGSRLSICSAQLLQTLPEMILSLIDILAGIILLCAAVYFSVKKVQDAGLYALSLLAISLGMWNFTQTNFAPLILQEKNVFTYYLSLIMLMLSVLPLIKSVPSPQKKRTNHLLNVWCIICAVASILQLSIQLLGLLDLREMLKITHGMIIISALVLVVSSFAEWHNRATNSTTARPRSAIWLLGAGTLADMILYYTGRSSPGLFFVLIAILFYVLLEGVRFFFSYIRQKQLLEEKETQLTLSRTLTMMSQIRSHFVFNILNAISGMCKYDPEKADETIVRFARYLRNNIDIMEDDHPLLFSTELAHLEDYVILEQVRFGDKITFYADIQTDQFLIPPLILQPVVENAIKHGLTQKHSGGTVILRTWEDGADIKISVEDNGVGFDLSESEKKTSIGLKNIRYRLRHLVHGTLEIKSTVGTGTTVTITIPKKEAVPCTSFM